LTGEDTDSGILYASGPERFLTPRRLYRHLKSEYPVGLCTQARHVRRARPPAIDDPQALLVLRRPTGDRAPLSDVYGDLMLPQLLQQLAHWGHTHPFYALGVVAYNQVRTVPRENHTYLLPDLQGAVDRYVQRDRGQGGIVNPPVDYVQELHLVSPSVKLYALYTPEPLPINTFLANPVALPARRENHGPGRPLSPYSTGCKRFPENVHSQ